MVVGIIFLAVELRQNTEAIQGQTRDALTEKQMTLVQWFSQPQAVAVYQKVQASLDELDAAENRTFSLLMSGMFREWENSCSQYERGLFDSEDFEARAERWRIELGRLSSRTAWAGTRLTFAPGFRAEIDRIMAEVGG